MWFLWPLNVWSPFVQTTWTNMVPTWSVEKVFPTHVPSVTILNQTYCSNSDLLVNRAGRLHSAPQLVKKNCTWPRGLVTLITPLSVRYTRESFVRTWNQPASAQPAIFFLSVLPLTSRTKMISTWHQTYMKIIQGPFQVVLGSFVLDIFKPLMVKKGGERWGLDRL